MGPPGASRTSRAIPLAPVRSPLPGALASMCHGSLVSRGASASTAPGRPPGSRTPIRLCTRL